MTGAIVALAVVVCVALLHGAFAAFSWFKFHLLDYGGYTNMLWNTAHGRLFRVLLDRSYLDIHLSFSLALLAPLFRIWDHPFLLAVVQWLCLVIGTGVLWRAGTRLRIEPTLRAAIVLLAVAYPFTQSVMLAEFHGVGVYFLLLPWLFLWMHVRRCMAWLPLVLTLGVREDTFLVVTPILFYFAWRERDRIALWLGIGALAYGLIAIFVLFPWISGMSLFEFRSSWLPGGAGHAAAEGVRLWTPRLAAVGWVLLPTVPWLRRRWRPIAAFVAVPLAVALLSRSHYQYSLSVHYSVAVMACLVLGVMQAAFEGRPREEDRPGPLRLAPALWLTLSVLVAHAARGLLPGGGQRSLEYARVHPRVFDVLAVSRQIPRAGLLVCPDRLSPFCANRYDLVTWAYWDRRKHPIDLVFADVPELLGKRRDRYEELLREGQFGVRVLDRDMAVLERGFETTRNAALLELMERESRTLAFQTTHHHAGKDVLMPDGHRVRYWPGGAAVTVAFGRELALAKGTYTVRVRLKLVPMEGDTDDPPAILRLHRAGHTEVLASHPLEVKSRGEGFRILSFPFELPEDMTVEPRVTGGVQELWLDWIRFDPS